MSHFQRYTISNTRFVLSLSRHLLSRKAVGIYIAIAVIIGVLGYYLSPVFANLESQQTRTAPTDQRDKFKTDLFTGAATYAYPISVPKGTNNLTPSVSLDYNSLGVRGGSSYAGLGWQLNKDYVSRDVHFTPDDLTDDKYVLHFQGGVYDLVYSSTDNTYHTKTETFTKIEKVTVPTPTPPPGPVYAPNFSGAYYNNRDLSGNPVLTRTDATINFDWGSGSPDSSVPSDNFSVRWTGTVSFAAGTYTFTTSTDDGVRLYIDNNLVINQWRDQGETPYSTTQTLSAGNHTIVMEYYEAGGGAVARLSWALPPTPTPTIAPNAPADFLTYFQGQYFNNSNWSGTPTFTRTDPSINFNWGSGGPGGGLGNDNFSVRWTKTLYVPEGDYPFSSWTDDGGTLFIDGNTILSGSAGSGPVSATTHLTAGYHTIQFDYAEATGLAYAKLYPTHSDTYWRVTTKDGTVYTFGKTGDAELNCQNRNYVTQWDLNNVSDTHANTINYVYANSPAQRDGVSYLSKITYNNDAQRNITFTYENNPYQQTRYDQGCQVTETSRLKTIQVNALGNLVHQYDLAYTQNPGGQSLLQSVTEKGNDGSALPPTVFTYKHQGNTWNTQESLWLNHADIDAWLGQTDVSMADVNGDGLIDIVKTTRSNSLDTWSVLLNNGNGWSSSYQNWVDHGAIDASLDSYYQTNVRLVDVTGDGLPDIVKTTEQNAGWDTWQILRNTGHSWNLLWETWVNNANISAKIDDPGVRIIDVNGDGLADIVKTKDLGNGYSEWDVFKNTGSGWNTTPEKWIDNAQINADLSKLNVILMDVNGDGLPDIVQSSYNGDVNGNTTPVTWKVNINTGTNWNTTAQTWLDNASVGANLQSANSTIADVNGDGLPDLVRSIDYGTHDEWDALLNTGHSWANTYTVLIDPNTQQLDMDIHNSTTKLVDVTGDGLPDILKGGADCSCSFDTWRVWKNVGTAPDLLSDVQGPQGGVVSFTYNPSTTFSNVGSDGIADLSFPLWIVTALTKDNGVSDSHHIHDVTTYSYANGLYSWQDKEFRGFQNITEIDSNGANKSYVFNQDDALKGQLASERTTDTAGNPYTQVENHWTSIQNNGYYIPLLQSEKQYTYDGSVSNPKVTETDYQYDSYGNVVKLSQLGDISQSGDERYTYNDYIYNPALWIMDKVGHTYTTASDTTKVSENWNYYDGADIAVPTVTPTPVPPQYFGNGSDGALTISANTVDSPIDSPCSGTMATQTLAATNTGFVPGQQILIIQMQGANAGKWERNIIQSYTNGTITTLNPLSATYVSSGGNKAQVLVLKQYTDVTIANGATWAAKLWNGTTGGLLAFLANGTVTVSQSGIISGYAGGFKGGSGGNFSPGTQGESSLGLGSQSTNPNGMGGGGGAEDTGNRESGGAGGGYGSSGANSSAAGSATGATGGTIGGSADLSTMLLGAGGGGGARANAGSGAAPKGGDGGGILFVAASHILASGIVSLNGGSGLNGSNEQSGAGGGSGGSIYLSGNTIDTGSNLITALGSSGGNPGSGNGTSGGSGGNGRIHIDYLTSLTGTTGPTADVRQVTAFSLPVTSTNNTTASTLMKGDLTKQVRWRDVGGDNPVTNYTYDTYGNKTQVTDANGHSTQYLYGVTDTTNTYPERVTNASGQSTQYTYQLGTGNVLSVTDPNGYAKTYTYDPFGRVVSEVDPYDTLNFPTMQYTYFDTATPSGQLVTKRVTAGTTNTMQQYTFVDGFGQTIQTRSNAQDPSQQIVTNTYYDGLGHVIKKSVPYADLLSSLYATPSAAEKVTLSDYDILGRQVQTTNPDASTKKVSYDHWIKTLTDENGHTTGQKTNAYGNVLEVDETNASGTGSAYVTNYQYDALNNLTKIVDSVGNNTTFGYDSLGNKVRQNDPDLGLWTYTYDGVGNLLTQTDNRNVTTTRMYDALNRLTKVDYPTDTDTLYVYDSPTIGTLSQVTDAAGTVAYAYDQRLRKTQEQRVTDGNTWTTGYVYDSANNLTARTNPDGEAITYVINNQGEIASVSGVLSQVNYNPLGKITQKTFANGLVTDYTYNPSDFRLQRIHTGDVQDLSYTYDPVGNVLTVANALTSKTQTFTYDALNRLLNAQVTGEGSTTYTYNPIGNLLSVSTNGNTAVYTYGENNAGVHALTTLVGSPSASPTPTDTPTPSIPTPTVTPTPTPVQTVSIEHIYNAHTTSGSSLTLNAVTIASGEQLIVSANGSDGNGNGTYGEVTGVTFGGVALTKVVDDTLGLADDGIYTSFWQLASPTPSTASVVITYNGNSAHGISGTAYTIANGRLTIDATSHNGNGATATSPQTNTITTVTNNALILDSFMAASSSETIVVGGAQIQDENVQDAGGSPFGNSHVFQTTHGTQTMSWTPSNTGRGYTWSAVAIAPVSSTTPTPTPTVIPTATPTVMPTPTPTSVPTPTPTPTAVPTPTPTATPTPLPTATPTPTPTPTPTNIPTPTPTPLPANTVNTGFLSDQVGTTVSNGWGPVEHNMSNGETGAGDGRTLNIGGRTYTKGLGVHAYSEVQYVLANHCSTFTSEVGVDNEVGGNGSVVFQVSADGTVLYTSPTLRGGQGPQYVSVTVTGKQNLKLVVTDAGDGNGSDHADWANARVTCSPDTSTQYPNFEGQYFANTNLSGSPVVTRNDTTINFDWGSGSPDPSLPNDNFSVRWMKSQNFSAGTYTFLVTGDDGVRFYIDGSRVLDKWNDEGTTTYTVSQSLSAGAHMLMMEYYEHTGGAVARLELSSVGGGTITARGENQPNEGKDRAFDGTTSTKWLDFSPTSWIQYQFPNGNEYVVNRYTISSANDAPERDPASWILKGSHDGVNWVTLDTQTGQGFSSRYQENSYTISNTTTYAYYKLDAITNHSGNIIQLSEIKFMSNE